MLIVPGLEMRKPVRFRILLKADDLPLKPLHWDSSALDTSHPNPLRSAPSGWCARAMLTMAP